MEVSQSHQFGPRGSAFSSRVLAEYDLTDSGLALLAEACRVLDLIDELDGLVQREGLTVPGSRGQVTVHPAVAEARQQRVTLARLLRQLDLDVEDEDETHAAPTIYSERARYAARSRWAREKGVGA